MPPRPLFLLKFNGRLDNLGDQFITRSLSNALRAFGDVAFQGAAPEFIRGTCPPTLPLPWPLAAVAKLLSGGRVYRFAPPGGRLWGRTPNAAKRALSALAAAVARRFLGPKFAIGTSVIPGTDYGWTADVDWIGVRDRDSLDALRAAGAEHADYFPDLSFIEPPPPVQSVPRGTIGFSFRAGIPEDCWASDYAPRVCAALRTLQGSLTSSDAWSPRFFHQVAEDAPFNRHLAGRMGIPLHTPRLTLESMGAFYRGCRFVVSNRLHCLLLGARFGAVPIALTSRGHTKVASLFRTVGWGALFVPIEEPASFEGKFDAFLRDEEVLRRLTLDVVGEQGRLGLGVLAMRFNPGR